MPTFKDFKLPDLGEGLTEGEILKWLVQPGDDVKLNQPIVEVETAKAAVEIPSPYAGIVSALHHSEGDTVDVGSPIITFDVDPSGTATDAGIAAPAQTKVAAQADMVPQVPHEPGMIGSPAPKAGSEEKIEVLVGSGPKSGKLTRRPRKVAAVEPAASEPAAGAAPKPQPARVSAAGVGARAAALATEVHVLAKPPVRKLARDLGVDLRVISGTGPSGTITRADVESAADGGAPEPVAAAPRRAVDFDPATREQRIPIKGVRKMMASAMVDSAFTAPHVTIFTTVDVTPMMELVERLRGTKDFADVRVSPLLIVAKALLLAVRRNPLINSTWDDAAQEIVVKDYVNLGIAAATPRGLIVPNIKDVDALTLPELAGELQQLVATARDGRTAPADMQGGTITITNVGVFGVDNGTPILNPGESAILCFGAVRDMPWVHEGQIAVRKVTQLSLSFDHRIVDGQLGSQFIADVAALMADPTLFLAWS
ncbi:MAG TPA: dihydrolipoamide acetyltransferase family protein [Mycobacteriales bacterium]|nr:dihydrolipoamide acetyltransferase family protein [Mycobacteriales bacterium]